MNYQKDNKDIEIRKYKAKKRIQMLMLFLGVPLLIAGALSLANFSGSLKLSIIGMTPFIFPVLLILMIPSMIKDMKRNQDNPQEEEIDGNKK